MLILAKNRLSLAQVIHCLLYTLFAVVAVSKRLPSCLHQLSGLGSGSQLEWHELPTH